MRGKRILISCSVIFLFVGIVAQGAASESPSTVHLYIFRSNDCPHCDLVKEQALAELADRTGCTVVPHYYDVDNPDNYKRLVLLEQRLNTSSHELPVIFVGGTALGGVREIQDRLEDTVRQLAASGGAGPLSMPSQSEIDQFFTPGKATATIHLVYFEEPGCRQCLWVEHMLRSLENQWPTLHVTRLEAAHRENKILLEVLCERAGIPESKRLIVPAIFVGTNALVGEEITDKNVAALLKCYETSGCEDATSVTDEERSAARDRLVTRVRTLGLTAVLAGGLVDGVNPCAFATVVFLVTYLASMGRSRGRILVAGIAYCAGVFVGYLAVGLGLSEVLLQFQVIPLLALILRWAIIGLVMVLALLSFYDAWIASRGNPKTMILKMPSWLRARMNLIAARQYRTSSLLVASFILGGMLSLIEFVCTGQIYLPLIQLTLSLSVDRVQTVGLLLVYNLAFCVPLLFVFGAAFMGIRSEWLNALLRRYVVTAKILLGAFFAALALTLVWFSHA